MAKLTPSSLSQSFERRTFVIGAIQGGLGLLLAARMGYIAVAENAKYEMESESNRVNLSLIPPRRGWILDRNGAPLASNRADFRVDIIPERLKDPEREVATVGQLLGLKPDQVADLNARIASAARFQGVPVASGLDYDQFAAVSVRQPELPGVVPAARLFPVLPDRPGGRSLARLRRRGDQGRIRQGTHPASRHARLQARQGRAREAVRKDVARRARRPPHRGHCVGPHRARPRHPRRRPGPVDQADHRRRAAGFRRAPDRPAIGGVRGDRLSYGRHSRR